ncbi:MAG TPA: DinB family protein [Phycisphaerae bacterium]
MNYEIGRPEPSEYGGGFARYIKLVPAGDIVTLLESQLAGMRTLLQNVSDDESLVHHAPYTWSIRQVVGHLTDSERVFGYRALRFARQDPTPLPSFDENAYMVAANFDRWELTDLIAEFQQLRLSHIAMFRHLEPAAWMHRGTASGQPMSVRAMAYTIAGHAGHHLKIVRTRLKQG